MRRTWGYRHRRSRRTVASADRACSTPLRTRRHRHAVPEFLPDEDGLAQDARRGADFGFTGKLAIHPRQVPVIRAAFLPSADEVARAEAIIEQYASGVAVVDGRMIDAPVLALAQQLLARARKGST